MHILVQMEEVRGEDKHMTYNKHSLFPFLYLQSQHTSSTANPNPNPKSAATFCCLHSKELTATQDAR